MTDNTDQKAPRKPRGFAAMGPEFQREIAAQGGRAAHRLGKAHRFSSAEARAAAAKRHAARNEQRAAEDAQTAANDTKANADAPQTTAPEEADEHEGR
ncbi:KGG domain-containing protein [Bordetella sp. N]|uniref:KGG domain-containing protein n=1 Tax=Bordetella sp. N TaxID=1746199 RepID=UPI00070B12B4|nr:KGG domain-containing protein [Bordetella sp. N]ALM83875.1 hypothetical protein ASB57_13640 [Bordetella sp. N]